MLGTCCMSPLSCTLRLMSFARLLSAMDDPTGTGGMGTEAPDDNWVAGGLTGGSEERAAGSS